MGKISELDMAIKDLRDAAATIKETADTLTEMFGGNAAEEAATPDESELTLEQVRAVLAEKSRQGHTAEIRSILQKYGAAKLSGVDPKHYQALLADVEVLADGS